MDGSKEHTLFDTALSQTFDFGHRHPSTSRLFLLLSASQPSVTRRAGGTTHKRAYSVNRRDGTPSFHLVFGSDLSIVPALEKLACPLLVY